MRHSDATGVIEGVDYGVFQDEQWDGIWRENDLQYYQAFSPREHADFVVDNMK